MKVTNFSSVYIFFQRLIVAVGGGGGGDERRRAASRPERVDREGAVEFGPPLDFGSLLTQMVFLCKIGALNTMGVSAYFYRYKQKSY